MERSKAARHAVKEISRSLKSENTKKKLILWCSELRNRFRFRLAFLEEEDEFLAFALLEEDEFLAFGLLDILASRLCFCSGEFSGREAAETFFLAASSASLEADFLRSCWSPSLEIMASPQQQMTTWQLVKIMWY